MPSGHRPATRRRSTFACLALACALVALAAATTASAATKLSELTGWGVAKPRAAAARPHPAKHCRGHRCCRPHGSGHSAACARAQGVTAPTSIPPTTAPGLAVVTADGGTATRTPGAIANPPSEPQIREESPAEGPSTESPSAQDPPAEGPSEEGDGEEVTPDEHGPDSGEGPGTQDQGSGGGQQPSPQNPPPTVSPPTPETLAWAPPTMVDPKTIELGTGYTHTSLSPYRDYIVKLPPSKKIGGTWLDGGHNVVVIGGSVTVPTGTDPGVAYDAQRNGIYIKDATGTVHIEGVLIDGSGGAEFDGIDINAPQATVQLENLRIIGVRGGFGAFHADVVQPWGGVKDLRIDRLTGSSNYQGLMLQPDLGPIGSAEISNVDLTATAEPPVDRGGHMLWLTRGSTSCAGYPVALSNVFLTPRPGSTLIQSVWPTTSGLPCNAAGTSSVDWPNLDVGGAVQEGPPPAGEFAPPQSAGLHYVSPGYAPAG